MAPRHISSDAYRRITLAAIAALIFIVITGGGVRLTGSGLGCSDWPTCEDGKIVAPLEYHAMVEFVNRTITGLVSVAVALAVLGSLRLEQRRRDLTALSWGLVAGVIAQILIGALVVRTELVPAAVSAHYLVSIVLIGNALVLHRRAAEPDGPARPIVDPSVRRLGAARCTAVAAVLLVGTLVTGSGPHSGDPGEVDRLGFDLQAIARLHSATAWVLAALSVAVAVQVVRTGAPAAVRRREQIVMLALLVQGGIGYWQYAAGVPPLLVAVHLLGSTLVFSAVAWAQLSFTSRARDRGVDVTTAATAPMEVEEPVHDEEVVPDHPWLAIVWNDPINLMSYVTFVLQKLFGYSYEKATALMLDVHEKGRAVVSSGTRASAERDVLRLHEHGLWATVQQDD